jgi:uncharacterized membrane protein
MGWFRRKLFTGLIIILPTAITAWVFYHLFMSIDNILKPLIEKYPFLDFPGFGFLIIVLIIILTGVFAGNLIGGKIITWGESIVARIPLISRTYTAVKQISEVFLKTERTVFRKAVLIEYPRHGIYVVGFVTSNWRFRGIDGKERNFINVFLPTTPNPTSGLFLMVPENEAIPLNCTIEDALKLVISGGAVIPYVHGVECNSHGEKPDDSTPS